MLDEYGIVKIIDFGLGKYSKSSEIIIQNDDSEKTIEQKDLTQIRNSPGTKGFIAPEQIMNAYAADIRSDIYSLGRTLLTLIGQKLPNANDIDIQYDLKNYSKDMKSLLDKMIQNNPDDRYQTPQEIINKIKSIEKKKIYIRKIPVLISILIIVFLILTYFCINNKQHEEHTKLINDVYPRLFGTYWSDTFPWLLPCFRAVLFDEIKNDKKYLKVIVDFDPNNNNDKIDINKKLKNRIDNIISNKYKESPRGEFLKEILNKMYEFNSYNMNQQIDILTDTIKVLNNYENFLTTIDIYTKAVLYQKRKELEKLREELRKKSENQKS
jgi:serine/threonine protein kinase